MQPVVVPLAVVWGLLAGAAVAAAPWRAWIGEPAGPEPAPAAPLSRSARWPALLGAVLCAALARLTGGHPELVVWLLLVPVGMLLARIDLAVRRLPDLLTLPALGGAVALLGAAALLPGHRGCWTRALLGAAVLGALYFGLLVANPSGMGLGDVKLAPTVGLVLGWYGWRFVFYGTFLAFGLGALTAGVLLAARRANRRTELPFGPFMLLGAVGGLLLTAC